MQSVTCKMRKNGWKFSTLLNVSYAITATIIINNNSRVCALSTSEAYQQARYLRTTQGSDAAQPLYQKLLSENGSFDRTAALQIAASSETPRRHDVIFDVACSTEYFRHFQSLLRQHKYCPKEIAHLVLGKEGAMTKLNVKSRDDRDDDQNEARHSYYCPPLYLNALAAGAACPKQPPKSGLECLIQLFLMGLCIPKATCFQFFTEHDVLVWERLGVAFQVQRPSTNDDDDDDVPWIVPYVHLMPVDYESSGNGDDISKSLFIATDLHPRCLSMVSVGTENRGAIMYIGPDSVALVQHTSSTDLAKKGPMKVTDIGTGSGIQALVVAARLADRNEKEASQHDHQMTCVDINPRALAFARWNFELNGLSPPRCILGNLVEEGSGRPWYGMQDNDLSGARSEPVEDQSWKILLGPQDLILANPPFLPVPQVDDTIQKRHGLFSSGGGSGEVVLEHIVRLASESLPSIITPNAQLAIVSEFMNPGPILALKLALWWNEGATNLRKTELDSSEHEGVSEDKKAATGILFTNELPLSAELYSRRRADDADEFEIWQQHMKRSEIETVSPGLLFIRIGESSSSTLEGADQTLSNLFLKHALVPKTDQGSIWTPTNRKAVQFTRQTWNKSIP